jgi:ABC-type transport system involved in multi-copper enzyme maturation permease subunit
MRQMGMRDLPYWTSWFLVNTGVNTIMVLLLIGVGNLYGLEVFRENAFGLMFSLLWLSAMAFTGLAFFFSTLAKTTSTARLFGIATFVITFIASPILVGVYYSDGSDEYNGLRVILARLPFMSFYQIVSQLISAASGSTNTGMTWDERQVNLLPYVEANTEEAIWTLEMAYLALIEGENE